MLQSVGLDVHWFSSNNPILLGGEIFTYPLSNPTENAWQMTLNELDRILCDVTPHT
jgi:hypothetical protein